MREKKNISKNYLVNTLYQLLLVIMPLLTLPYLSRVIGAEGIGVYSFNNSIISYFMLFAVLGTGIYGQREIAYHQDDKDKASKIFWEIQTLRTVSTIISVIFLLIFVFFFGREKIILLILVPSLLNVLFDISWFWNGLEQFAFMTKRFIVLKLLYLISVFIFVKKAQDVYLYIALEVCFSLFSNLSLWPHLRKYIHKVKKIKPFRHFKAVFYLFIPSLAIQLYTVLDKTMLGLFAINGYAENGYYEQAQGFIKSCLVLVTSLVTVMSPAVSYCHARKDYDRMKIYLYNSYRYVWFVTILLSIVTYSIAPYFIPLYLGPGYDKVILLVQTCCPLFMIIGLSNITGLQYFIPCDKIKEHTCSLIVGSCVNIVLNLLLIPYLQSVGASLASVIAELSVTITQFVLVTRFGIIKINKIMSSSLKFLISGVVSIITSLYFLKYVSISWLSIILIIILESSIYILILFLLREKLVITFYYKLRLRLKNNE